MVRICHNIKMFLHMFICENVKFVNMLCAVCSIFKNKASYIFLIFL